MIASEGSEGIRKGKNRRTHCLTFDQSIDPLWQTFTKALPGKELKTTSCERCEGDKERVQMFNGTVIARSGHDINETFTVRRMAYGLGVERVFPIHSPRIVDVEVIRRGDVSRAKLYYLRDRQGKDARVREKLRGAK